MFISKEQKDFSDDVIRFTGYVHRVVGVTENNQYRSKNVMQYGAKLDFSSPDDKAILEAPFGKVKVKIRPAKAGYVGDHKCGSLTIGIGDDGKDSLREELSRLAREKADDPTAWTPLTNWFEMWMNEIGTSHGLIPENMDYEREMATLKNRDDFEPDKDYSFLYEGKTLEDFRPKGRSSVR